VLLALEPVGARLASFEGGNKHNAIPRESETLLLIPAKKVDEAAVIANMVTAIVKSELATIEPDLDVSFEKVNSRKKFKVVRKGEQQKIIKTIASLPHGVIKMSADIAGLVETSTNVAVIRTAKDTIRIATSQRSSVASEIEEIAQSVSFIFELGGADVGHTDAYPGWKPNMDSPILAIAKSAFRRLYGKDPEVKAIHAGLECGIIGERFPGMDMVSLGPTLEGVHSPDEKIYIDTVERFWQFLLEILKRVN
jgi:dipeptidase D